MTRSSVDISPVSSHLPSIEDTAADNAAVRNIASPPPLPEKSTTEKQESQYAGKTSSHPGVRAFHEEVKTKKAAELTSAQITQWKDNISKSVQGASLPWSKPPAWIADHPENLKEFETQAHLFLDEVADLPEFHDEMKSKLNAVAKGELKQPISDLSISSSHEDLPELKQAIYNDGKHTSWIRYLNPMTNLFETQQKTVYAGASGSRYAVFNFYAKTINLNGNTCHLYLQRASSMYGRPGWSLGVAKDWDLRMAEAMKIE